MGIGTFIKGIFSGEALGAQTINTTEIIFSRAQNQRPYDEPHSWLASTWLNRAKAKGHNIDSPEMQMFAFSETYLHSCIKPPLCARSLGLYFLYKENPEIIAKYPIFGIEFNQLMEPVIKAQQTGKIDELYSKYNPNMAKEAQKHR